MSKPNARLLGLSLQEMPVIETSQQQGLKQRIINDQGTCVMRRVLPDSISYVTAFPGLTSIPKNSISSFELLPSRDTAARSRLLTWAVWPDTSATLKFFNELIIYPIIVLYARDAALSHCENYLTKVRDQRQDELRAARTRPS